MTFLAELAASRLRLVTQDGRPSGSAKLNPSVSKCSRDALIVTAGFPCQDLSIAGKQQGLTGSRSSLGLRLIGLLWRTSTTPGASGCPSCGAAFSDLGMPACRFECEPLTLERSISEPEGGWLPTPTASSYGSCRGGGAGRVGKWRLSLQARGILHPEDWERMMGYPPNWTKPADTRSETRSSLELPNSSFAESGL